MNACLAIVKCDEILGKCRRAQKRHRPAARAIGLDAVTHVSNGGLDANWLTAHGLPTVTLGCGQAGIHTVNETLEIDSFLQACRIGLLLATASEGES